MSFKMLSEGLNITDFNLLTDTNSPTTGIKINLNIVNCYENQTTFRFEDVTASKDATLKNLIISKGEYNNGENPEYKEYQLTPIFDSKTLNYGMELLEYVDKININAIKNDEKASLKIRKPKRDEDGNLVYSSDGTTIEYEENEIDSGQQEVILNKLGDPNTNITIIVIAEDGVTTNSYNVSIKRPYGTIKGSIQLGDDIRDSMQDSYGVYTKYSGEVTVYKSDQFNWDGISEGEVTYEELEELSSEMVVKTDEDSGEYEIKIIPGNYDIQLSKKGFLDSIVKNITISEGDEINLENKILKPGDVDRDGVIGLQDYVEITNRMDAAIGDENYGEEYDFGQKGYIALIDITTVLDNLDNLVMIENYNIGG